MEAHLNEAGGEFTSGINVVFNDDPNTTFNPRFITVNKDGNINWNPKLNNLDNGLYHFYIASTDAWHTSTNINNLNEHDQIYGDAYIHITDTKDEIEWKLDLNKIAEKFKLSPNELKTIKVQYLRLGNQWTVIAGTPTGTVIGIILCLLVIICGYIFKKRK